MKTRSVKSSQVSALGNEIRRRGGRHRVGVDGEPPRTGGAELQPGRGRARPAVEQEGHRPGARVGAIELVGGVGDIGLRLALVVEQADRTGGGGEVERAPGKRERVSGGGIRRQAMLLGGSRRVWSAARPRRFRPSARRRRGRRGAASAHARAAQKRIRNARITRA